jgi:hypothetical protein
MLSLRRSLLFPAAVAILGMIPVGTIAAPKPPAAPGSDAEIERDIRQRFAKSKIGTNGFRVRVQNGIATLEGKTDILQHKGTATRLAKSAGARAVENRIEVSEAARQKASANLAKGRRRAQANRGDYRSEPREQPDPAPPAPRRAVVQAPR